MKPGHVQHGVAALTAAVVVVGLVMALTALTGTTFRHTGPFAAVGAPGDAAEPPGVALTFLVDSLFSIRTGDGPESVSLRASRLVDSLNVLVRRIGGTGRAPRLEVDRPREPGGSYRIVRTDPEGGSPRHVMWIAEEDARLEGTVEGVGIGAEALAHRWMEALQTALDHVAASPVWASGE